MTGNFVMFIGAEYLVVAAMYAVEAKWGLALTFFAYALANVGLYITARV